MEAFDILTAPGNAFDEGTRLNNENFKALRDAILILKDKIDTLSDAKASKKVSKDK